MDHEFWHERWQSGRIKFHQGAPNPMLLRHHAVLGAPGAGEVLVPLCGKAIDLWWLAERGWQVLGVELSPVAVRDFFAERGVEAQVSRAGSFEAREGAGVRLLCGDFFSLGVGEAGAVVAAYDRAALVALPEAMRRRYVEHLLDRLPPAAPVLLVTFEYPQHEADGPPFSVGEAEVRALVGERRRVQRLESADVLEASPDLKARGISRLTEHAFALTA